MSKIPMHAIATTIRDRDMKALRLRVAALEGELARADEVLKQAPWHGQEELAETGLASALQNYRDAVESRIAELEANRGIPARCPECGLPVQRDDLLRRLTEDNRVLRERLEKGGEMETQPPE